MIMMMMRVLHAKARLLVNLHCSTERRTCWYYKVGVNWRAAILCYNYNHMIHISSITYVIESIITV